MQYYLIRTNSSMKVNELLNDLKMVCNRECSLLQTLDGDYVVVGTSEMQQAALESYLRNKKHSYAIQEFTIMRQYYGE